MTQFFFTVGVIAAVVLIPLLLVTIIDPRMRIWPTPGPGSIQGYVFWPLFRSLNVLPFVLALLDREQVVGLPLTARLLALTVCAGAGLFYIYSILVLGRSNTYCGKEGLVARGVYRWTRNPQYAAAIPMFASLAIAADNMPTYVVAASVIAVYWLMTLAEESWLEGVYGAEYVRYCGRVPRFFNWRRGLLLGIAVVRQSQRTLLPRLTVQYPVLRRQTVSVLGARKRM